MGSTSTTVLSSGATITGGSSTQVFIDGTITSGGAFNIGASVTLISFGNNSALNLNSTADSTFASPLGIHSGSAGTITKNGVGRLTLSGVSSSTLDAGDTIIAAGSGALNVTGSLHSGSIVTVAGGTLTGPGATVGVLGIDSSFGGTVSPGGTLNTTNAVTLNAATTYNAAILTATTASNLRTASAIDLGGATLTLSSVAGGLALNNSFTIVNNTAMRSVPIAGTFAGLPQGARISGPTDSSGDNVTFEISYIGGDGNDATLKVVGIRRAFIPTFGSASRTGNGFTVQISNYSNTYVWSGTATAGGTVAITDTGLVTVTGVAAGTSSTATIMTTGDFYPSGSAQVTETSLSLSLSRPGAPTSVSAVAGNAQAVVSFTAPASTGGATISAYTVTARLVGGGTAAIWRGSSSPATVLGLSNGTAYTFTVEATNIVGMGAASSASNVVTPATTPGAPTSVSAVAGNAQAVVSFTAPASTGGATISAYTVTGTPVGGGKIATATGTGSPIAVTGLITGRAYTFTVTGTNSVGSSSSSNTSAAITVEKLAQTITWATPTDQLSIGGFTLNATSSSGLPVEFDLIDGPASLTGAYCLLSGAPLLSGTQHPVFILARQSGNATYQAAPDSMMVFTVWSAQLNTYHGEIVSGGLLLPIGPYGVVAAAVQPGGRDGALLFSIPGSGVHQQFKFTLNADNSFSQSVDRSSNVASEPNAVARTSWVGFSAAAPSTAAAPGALTIRGTLVNGRLQGTIEPLGLVFSANVSPVAGPTGNIAGLYTTQALGAIPGTQTVIIGSNSEVLVVTTIADVSTSAFTTLGSDNAYSAQTTTSGANLTLRGSIDPLTTVLRGSLGQTGKADMIFQGLASTQAGTGRLINLSSRGRVGPSPRTLITGFVIGGSAPKRVLLRATGPALTSFGVTGTLPNPRLQLYDGKGKLILENDDWSGAETVEAATRVGAFALVAGSKDAALVTTLSPDAYTMHVVDHTGAGVGLAEVYDASVNASGEYQRLINISAGGEAGSGENVLIAGFVVNGNAPKRVLIRGIGPALAAFGVSGVLVDPRLRVYENNRLIGDNDNWSAVATDATAVAAAARDTGAFTLGNASKDAALILTLAPGAYTAQVASSDGISSGAALVEIYELP